MSASPPFRFRELQSRVTRMFAARAPVAALLCSSRHRRVWPRRGLGVSNNFIPLYMADHLQQSEPGGSVGRGPTADHHTTEEHVQFQPPAAAVLANAAAVLPQPGGNTDAAVDGAHQTPYTAFDYYQLPPALPPAPPPVPPAAQQTAAATVDTRSCGEQGPDVGTDASAPAFGGYGGTNFGDERLPRPTPSHHPPAALFAPTTARSATTPALSFQPAAPRVSGITSDRTEARGSSITQSQRPSQDIGGFGTSVRTQFSGPESAEGYEAANDSSLARCYDGARRHASQPVFPPRPPMPVADALAAAAPGATHSPEHAFRRSVEEDEFEGDADMEDEGNPEVIPLIGAALGSAFSSAKRSVKRTAELVLQATSQGRSTSPAQPAAVPQNEPPLQPPLLQISMGNSRSSSPHAPDYLFVNADGMMRAVSAEEADQAEARARAMGRHDVHLYFSASETYTVGEAREAQYEAARHRKRETERLGLMPAPAPAAPAALAPAPYSRPPTAARPALIGWGSSDVNPASAYFQGGMDPRDAVYASVPPEAPSSQGRSSGAPDPRRYPSARPSALRSSMSVPSDAPRRTPAPGPAPYFPPPTSARSDRGMHSAVGGHFGSPPAAPPPPPAAAAPMAFTVADLTSLVREVGGAFAEVQAANMPVNPSASTKLPKCLRQVPGTPGQSYFGWANARSTNHTLARMVVPLDHAAQMALYPATEQQLEDLEKRCSADNIFRSFRALHSHLAPGARPLAFDVARVYQRLIEDLVSCCSPQQPAAAADAMAARLLQQGFNYVDTHRGNNAGSGNSGEAILLLQAAQASGALSGGRQTHPSRMLNALANAYCGVAPGAILNNGNRDYLSAKFRMDSLDSMPSSVLSQALVIADALIRDGLAAASSSPASLQEDTAKELFLLWLRKGVEHEFTAEARPLAQPLYNEMRKTSYSRMPFADWVTDLSVWESEERGFLQPLIQFLHSLATAQAGPRRGARTHEPRVSAIEELTVDGVPTQAVQPLPPPSGYAGHPTVVEPAAVSVAQWQLQQAKDQALAWTAQSRALAATVQNPPALTEANIHAIAARVNALSAASRHFPLPLVAAASAYHNFAPPPPAGLHPMMAANFVGVHAAEEGSWSLCGGPVPDPAFAFFGIKYDAAWQAQWGLTSMPPPGGKIRTRLKVVEICHAAGIPLPANFRHEKPIHMGGSSCPFCQWVSMNQGTGTVVWYFHAQDSTTKREDVPGPVEKGAPPVPRPLAGAERRRHQFVHQVGKCIYGHAIAQALCRRQMDAGQSSECVRILDEPPQEAWPRT